MPESTRNRVLYGGGKRTYRATGVVNQRNTIISKEYCRSWVGTGDNQYFQSASYRLGGGAITGTEASALSGYVWEDYLTDFQAKDAAATSHLPITMPNLSEYASTTLKRTNPSRASVDALVSSIELAREAPGMVKEAYAGGLAIFEKRWPRKLFQGLKLAGKINLLIQFGLMPLISDMSSLLELNSLVDARKRELDRLYGRGLRRTIHLDSFVRSAKYPNVTVQSEGLLVRQTITKKTLVTVKGHARWSVPINNLPTNDVAVRARALALVANAHLDPYALYELMPWSWLIDYFTNVGDVLSLTRNSLLAIPDTPRIMTHTTTSVTSPPTTAGGCRVSGIDNFRETKLRQIVPITLTNTQLELLSARQLSILGSLSVVKGLK
nr:MAG: hypothetical protein 1 [Leviviridae sp.]